MKMRRFAVVALALLSLLRWVYCSPFNGDSFTAKGGDAGPLALPGTQNVVCESQDDCEAGMCVPAL
jgi:hypothetical protein